MIFATSNPYDELARARVTALLYALARKHGPVVIERMIDRAHDERGELELHWTGLVPEGREDVITSISRQAEAFWGDRGDVVHLLDGVEFGRRRLPAGHQGGEDE